MAPQPFYEDRGTPIAVSHVLRALAQLGYHVDVLTYPLGQGFASPGLRLFRSGNPLRIRRVPIGFSIRKLVLDSSLVASLVRRLGSTEYACIHAVEEAAFPALVLGRRRGIPVIYDMQSSLPEQLTGHRPFRPRPVQKGLRGLERWLLRRADAIVTSAGLAPRVLAITPQATVREWHFAATVPRPSTQEVEQLKRELRIAASAPVVVYGGNFARFQGIRQLLDAVPLVRADIPSVVFVLVGAAGPARPRLQERIASLEKVGAVRLVPREPHARLQRYLAMADVLVSPRLRGTNLPLKIFDYLAAGRPILATDVAAHRSVLDPTRAALVEPDSTALARGLVDLLRDHGRRASLARAARDYADRNLGWIGFVQVVGELYDEVCSPRTASDAA